MTCFIIGLVIGMIIVTVASKTPEQIAADKVRKAVHIETQNKINAVLKTARQGDLIVDFEKFRKSTKTNIVVVTLNRADERVVNFVWFNGNHDGKFYHRFSPDVMVVRSAEEGTPEEKELFRHWTRKFFDQMVLEY